MITIQLVSEDFSAQELMEHLHKEGLLQGLQVEIIPVKKEGLFNLEDLLQFLASDEFGQKVLFEALKETFKFALKKAYNNAFPNPHILIRFLNGQEKKILYEGKSDASIVKELLAEISDGEVVQVFFKS